MHRADSAGNSAAWNHPTTESCRLAPADVSLGKAGNPRYTLVECVPVPKEGSCVTVGLTIVVNITNDCIDKLWFIVVYLICKIVNCV